MKYSSGIYQLFHFRRQLLQIGISCIITGPCLVSVIDEGYQRALLPAGKLKFPLMKVVKVFREAIRTALDYKLNTTDFMDQVRREGSIAEWVETVVKSACAIQ